MKTMINDILITPLSIIKVPAGDVMHAMKKKDNGFNGFGEVYFSNIIKGEIKGWKQHTKMTLNLVVPIGEIRFVLFDDVSNVFQQVNLSRENYCRLTVPPMIWVAFEGVSSNAMLANIANIHHNPNEVNKKEIEEIQFNW